MRPDVRKVRIPEAKRDPAGAGRWFKALLALAAVLVALAVGALLAANQTSRAAIRKVKVVRAGSPNPESPAGIVLQGSGYVVPRRTIRVYSKVTGRVAMVEVERGDNVTPGQLLARLEDQEFRANFEEAVHRKRSAAVRLEALLAGSRPEEIALARARLERALVAQRLAAQTYGRVRRLRVMGFATDQELDEAKARLHTAHAETKMLAESYRLAVLGPRAEEIEQARAELAAWEARENHTRTMLEATFIRSPIAGVVIERHVEPGDLVSAQFSSASEGAPKGPVVTIADVGELLVEVDVSQRDFARLPKNALAKIQLEGFAGKEYDALLDEIAPTANRQRGTIQVKLKIAQPDRDVRPGMSVIAGFLNESTNSPSYPPGVKLLPKDSIVRESNERAFVYLAEGDKAKRVAVHALQEFGEGVLVEGLSGSELVIVSDTRELRDGERVETVEVQEGWNGSNAR